uniref:Uncharacterized protein n=1 Tax=Arundo donax TaxID=35708 RepID=A0A0A9BLF5_ARUDO
MHLGFTTIIALSQSTSRARQGPKELGTSCLELFMVDMHSLLP